MTGTNLYRKLKELLPAPPLLVCVVVAINEDGTSTVQHPGGQLQKVRGTVVAVGSPAFVRNGVIEGAAPALGLITIEV